jgi:hypothetical protein
VSDPREDIRAQYRPPVIKTLFVGESVPNNGGFFYCPPGGAILNYFQQVIDPNMDVGAENSPTTQFLRSFKDRGWFLDDLVSTPVDHLPPKQRMAACKNSVSSLAERISEYKPSAVVCILMRIEPQVRQAIILSRIKPSFYALPFPGMGQQLRFIEGFREILPDLPTIQE